MIPNQRRGREAALRGLDGHQVDDSAQREISPDRRSSAANHLDAVEDLARRPGPRDPTAVGIVHRDAVEENERSAGLRAAPQAAQRDRTRGHIGHHAALLAHGGEPRHLAQHRVDSEGGGLAHLVFEHADVGRDVGAIPGGARGGDGDAVVPDAVDRGGVGVICRGRGSAGRGGGVGARRRLGTGLSRGAGLALPRRLLGDGVLLRSESRGRGHPQDQAGGRRPAHQERSRHSQPFASHRPSPARIRLTARSASKRGIRCRSSSRRRSSSRSAPSPSPTPGNARGWPRSIRPSRAVGGQHMRRIRSGSRWVCRARISTTSATSPLRGNARPPADRRA